MPSRKQRTDSTPGKPTADDGLRGTLKAVRRALHLQTARVAELQARVNQLTNGRERVPVAARRDCLTDTEIYWRRRC